MGLPPTTPTADLTQAALYQLRLLLAQQSAPKDTAALIIETVLGEGGYVPAPPEFLRGLRQICDEHGILLIIDEVQCGFGRTGTWWAIEESGVKPDILLSAKVRSCLHDINHTYRPIVHRDWLMASLSALSSAGRN